MASIPRILEQHFAEYTDLLPVYRALRLDDGCTEADLRVWEDRLAAHRDALLLDPPATARLLEKAFADGDPAGVAAATDIALRQDAKRGVARALEFIAACQAPEQAADVIVSLRDGNADLTAWSDDLDSAAEGVAAAIIELQAQSGSLSAALSKTLARLFHSESPAVREAAWRIVGDVSLPR